MKRISILLRKIGTLVLFAWFSTGALTLGVAVYAVARLFISDARRRALFLRRCSAKGFRSITAAARALRAYSVRVEGHVPSAEEVRNTVIIANHPTLIDYMILTSFLPENTTCVVSGRLMRSFMRHIISHMLYISNDLPLEDWHALINPEDAILIFPEGTRSFHHDWKIRFRRGASNLALRLGRDIIPVRIVCSEKNYLGSGFLNLRIPDHVPVITFTFGSRILAREYLGNGTPVSLAARKLTSDLEERYASWLGARSGYSGENGADRARGSDAV